MLNARPPPHASRRVQEGTPSCASCGLPCGASSCTARRGTISLPPCPPPCSRSTMVVCAWPGLGCASGGPCASRKDRFLTLGCVGRCKSQAFMSRGRKTPWWSWPAAASSPSYFMRRGSRPTRTVSQPTGTGASSGTRSFSGARGAEAHPHLRLCLRVVHPGHSVPTDANHIRLVIDFIQSTSPGTADATPTGSCAAKLRAIPAFRATPPQQEELDALAMIFEEDLTLESEQPPALCIRLRTDAPGTQPSWHLLPGRSH